MNTAKITVGTIRNSSKRITSLLLFALLALPGLCGSFTDTGQANATAQQPVIMGTVIDAETGLPIPFAHIALFDTTGSYLVSGTTSSPDGEFYLRVRQPGQYQLRISAVGYDAILESAELEPESILELGAIALTIGVLSHEDIVFVGRQTAARSGANATTFYINDRMQNASSTGTDILKLIPGIQVDILQNISLEGSPRVMILVDGRERDRHFIHQLPASQIAHVEVIHTPSSRHNADVTGVIHIVLKKERDTGWGGHVHAEAPSSRSEVYLFPSYSLHYSSGKLNLFTSYNGEFSYLDIHEKWWREVHGPDELHKTGSIRKTTIGQNRESQHGLEYVQHAEPAYGLQAHSSRQYLRQKDWSHRFHYGFDYFIDERNVLNVYSWYNPWSRKRDGDVYLVSPTMDFNDRPVGTAGAGQSNVNEGAGQSDVNEGAGRLAQKVDDDINHSFFYSLYYKRLLGRTAGHEVSFDASMYHMRGENSTTFLHGKAGNLHVNSMKPKQRSVIFKLDYVLPLTESVQIGSGLRSSLRVMQDAVAKDFHYDNDVHATYGTVSYNASRFTLQTGLRFQYARLKQYGKLPASDQSGALPATYQSGTLPESGQQIASKAAALQGDQPAIGQRDDFSRTLSFLLPHLAINYRLAPGQSLRFSCRRSLAYPWLYQLNPSGSFDDPFTVRSGNPELKPEVLSSAAIEYSRIFGNHFISTQVYYHHIADAIRNLTTITEEGVFKTSAQNPGNIHEYGIRFSGTLDIGNLISINPYLRIFEVHSRANRLAKELSVTNRKKISIDAGIAAFASFGNGFTGSFKGQYASPLNEFQGTSYSGALYFLSLDKAFGQGFKAGVVSGIPFTRSFTYHGSVIDSFDFQSRSEGNIQMSVVPFWFTFGYQFSSGNKRNRIDRATEEMDRRPGRGF